MNEFETIASTIKNETVPGANSADRVGGLLLSICGLLNVYQNVYIVDPESSNFPSIQTAVDEAEAGDTIIIMPGTYNESGIGKDGLNYFFFPGANVMNSQAGSIWKDDVTKLEINVYGYGKFHNLSTNDVIHISNPSSNVNIHAISIVAATNRAVAGYHGSINITSDLVQSADGVIDSVGASSGDLTMVVRAKQIIAGTNYAIEFDGGDISIYADEILGGETGSPPIGLFSGLGSLHIQARKVISPTWYGIEHLAAGVPLYLKDAHFDTAETNMSAASNADLITVDNCYDEGTGLPYVTGAWGCKYVNKQTEIMITNGTELPDGADPEVVYIDMGFITKDISVKFEPIYEPRGYFPIAMSIYTKADMDGLVDIYLMLNGMPTQLMDPSEFYGESVHYIEHRDTTFPNAPNVDNFRLFALRADNNNNSGFRCILKCIKYAPHTVLRWESK